MHLSMRPVKSRCASSAAAAASRAAATATCPRSACTLPRRCSCSCCSSCSRLRRVHALHAAQALDTSKCAASEIVVGRPGAWAANAPGPSDGSDRRPRAPAHARRDPPSRPRLPNAGPAHILAQSPTPAPRARATRRACLASADASRRDVQNPPRSICPRDGSREREPQTCANAHRVLSFVAQEHANLRMPTQ